MIHCSNCNATLKEGAKFCTHCGSPIKELEQTKKVNTGLNELLENTPKSDQNNSRVNCCCRPGFYCEIISYEY